MACSYTATSSNLLCITSLCVQCQFLKANKNGVLDAVVSAHFSPPSKVGALVPRKVIFFFHIYPKSPGLLYGWSLKVGEMASRCTLMGISVAEICGIEMTSSDSYSLLSSPRLPAGPRLRPSVWVTPHSQTQRRYWIRSSCSFFSASRPIDSAVAAVAYTLRLSCGLLRHFFKRSSQCLTLNYAEHEMTYKDVWKRCMPWPCWLSFVARTRFPLLVPQSTFPKIGSWVEIYNIHLLRRR